jgi:hypothetical protein
VTVCPADFLMADPTLANAKDVPRRLAPEAGGLSGWLVSLSEPEDAVAMAAVVHAYALVGKDSSDLIPPRKKGRARGVVRAVDLPYKTALDGVLVDVLVSDIETFPALVAASKVWTWERYVATIERNRQRRAAEIEEYKATSPLWRRQDAKRLATVRVARQHGFALALRTTVVDAGLNPDEKDRRLQCIDIHRTPACPNIADDCVDGNITVSSKPLVGDVTFDLLRSAGGPILCSKEGCFPGRRVEVATPDGVEWKHQRQGLPDTWEDDLRRAEEEDSTLADIFDPPSEEELAERLVRQRRSEKWAAAKKRDQSPVYRDQLHAVWKMRDGVAVLACGIEALRKSGPLDRETDAGDHGVDDDGTPLPSLDERIAAVRQTLVEILQVLDTWSAS